jgi:hypothetical protein
MEFVEMEQKLLMALNWHVNGPTVLGFVQHYMTFFPETVHSTVIESMFDYARYQTELALADQSMVHLKLSEVALASLLNALEGIDPSLISLKAQTKFLRNIERYCDMDVGAVEIIQAKLSMLMVSMLSDDFASIIAASEADFETDDDEYVVDERTGKQLYRRNSPVSVIRGHGRIG